MDEMIELAAVPRPGLLPAIKHSTGTQPSVLWGVASSSASSMEAPRAVRGAAALKMRYASWCQSSRACTRQMQVVQDTKHVQMKLWMV
jgi:hypothetical protein